MFSHYFLSNRLYFPSLRLPGLWGPAGGIVMHQEYLTMYVIQNISKVVNFDGAGPESCSDRPGAMYYVSQTTPTLVLRCHGFSTLFLAYSGGVSWDLRLKGLRR